MNTLLPEAASTPGAYGALLITGILVSAIFWSRLARRSDGLIAVYVCGLVGAFAGAKVLYLVIDGWRHLGQPDLWLQLATGKTLLGALPGGYVGVELGKKLTGYRAFTGDWFAVVAPGGILIGRLGCLVHGCCQGRLCEPAWWTVRGADGAPRWPAVPAEMAFNIVMLVAALLLRRAGRLQGQLFHVYLIAYGAFRFFHEFLRNEQRLAAGLTGYQLAAAALCAFGVIAFAKRHAAQRRAAPPG